ncbi:MAG: adenosine kinase [Pseudomonadota bacterium]
MTQNALDVLGVGNAIVDVLAKADDQFLADHKIEKGGMTLIDGAQATSIYDAMAPGVEISGGSVANSIACVASLGGKGGYVGKVADDTLGGIFRHDLQAIDVEYETTPLTDGPGTGRCLVNVTPDAQRSMTTFLGAATCITADDIDASQIARAAITFFEGYLFDVPKARDAFVAASTAAHDAGQRTSLTLSDAGCVERHFDRVTAFVGDHVDILLANEHEAATLFGSSDLAVMAEKAREAASLTAITRSGEGSILVPREGDIVTVEAVAPPRLVDTTGAGDAYAAGLLFGVAKGMDLARAGRIASLAASEVISHFGARPETPLEKLASDAGLL